MHLLLLYLKMNLPLIMLLFIFGDFRWCSSRCIDLHIEISYHPTYGPDGDPSITDEEHAWISSLKSLVVIARGSLTGDEFVHRFLKRFARRREPDSFHRLWVEWQNKGSIVNTLYFYSDDVPLTTSLALWPNDRSNFPYDYIGLRQLEHVANAYFSSMASRPDVKYIRGSCIDEEV